MHVVAHGHRILSHRTVPGLRVDLEETPDAIVGKLIVEAGAQIAQPIHTCFGLAHPTGKQQIKIDVQILEGAQARVLSHCLFPFAQAAEHRMQATMEACRSCPTRRSRSARAARYFSDFSLLSGSVGRLDIDYLVEVEDEGIAELSAKIFAHKTDHITLKEAVMLRGECSRSLIKTRVVLEGQAKPSAIPIVRVFHPEAKVTHEAAIGSVDKKELETLMARGLSPEQAVELIVSEILR